jgi:hypothetical protein
MGLCHGRFQRAGQRRQRLDEVAQPQTVFPVFDSRSRLGSFVTLSNKVESVVTAVQATRVRRGERVLPAVPSPTALDLAPIQLVALCISLWRRKRIGRDGIS